MYGWGECQYHEQGWEGLTVTERDENRRQWPEPNAQFGILRLSSGDDETVNSMLYSKFLVMFLMKSWFF